MLLITDRVEESRLLERMLALWGPCSVIDLKSDANLSVGTHRLIVTNVELSNKLVVDSVRSALGQYRRSGTPYLCLLNDQSPRATIQAQAIGATTVLPASTSANELLATVSRILDGDEASDASDGPAKFRRHFVAATAALADMLGAAANGTALPMRVIDAGVDSINQAADKADLGAWLDVVWNHDDLTYQHCLLVAGLAAAFGRELGFAPDDRKLLTCAAVLHDIGKARIPLEILHKSGKLAPEEWNVMRGHPALGHEMLVKSGGFAPQVVEAARSHHEYLDGSGYPDGLRDDQISDVVRIITICDIYAALIERRAYKPPMPAEQAYGILREMGSKLDAALLRAFRQVILPKTKAMAAA